MTRAACTSLCLALALTLVAASPAAAQTGQINGVVTDNTGGVVPGALIKALEVATGLARETVSGADGRYTFTSLRPTTYDVSVELSGFRPAQRKGVLLQANQNLTMNFSVELGTLAETVTVSGESPLVDVVVGHAQRGRRFQAHRRAPAQRPRRRHLEHPGARHGADDGGSRIGEDDSRRAAHVDQRHRIAAGLVPSRRHQPLRPVLPAEPAVPVS